MSILWRYILVQYLKVLVFCVVAFIAVLITLRLDEIASFASLGPQGIHILYFTLYQIPYVLPIAIPVSALISAIVLVQHLSQTHELTALRAAGLSLRDILAPLLIAATFMSMVNFYIVSEMATGSHLSTSLIKKEFRSINPLLMLSNKHLMKLRGIYFDTMGASRLGETAADIVIAMPNKKNNRISLLVAEKLEASSEDFVGDKVSLISSLKTETPENFDHLMLENIGEAKTSLKDFSQMIQNKIWTLNNDHLRMSLLMVRMQNDAKAFAEAKTSDKPLSEIKQIQRSIYRTYTEVIRRFSVAIAVLTFTLMGAAFGMDIGRNRTNKGLIFIIVLGALYLAAYFSAKGIDHLIIASSLFYIVPHILIVGLSIWKLNRTTRGLE